MQLPGWWVEKGGHWLFGSYITGWKTASGYQGLLFWSFCVSDCPLISTAGIEVFTQMLHGMGIFSYISPCGHVSPKVGKQSIHGAKKGHIQFSWVFFPENGSNFKIYQVIRANQITSFEPSYSMFGFEMFPQNMMVFPKVSRPLPKWPFSGSMLVISKWFNFQICAVLPAILFSGRCEFELQTKELWVLLDISISKGKLSILI